MPNWLHKLLKMAVDFTPEDFRKVDDSNPIARAFEFEAPKNHPAGKFSFNPHLPVNSDGDLIFMNDHEDVRTAVKINQVDSKGRAPIFDIILYMSADSYSVQPLRFMHMDYGTLPREIVNRVYDMIDNHRGYGSHSVETWSPDAGPAGGAPPMSGPGQDTGEFGFGGDWWK